MNMNVNPVEEMGKKLLHKKAFHNGNKAQIKIPKNYQHQSINQIKYNKQIIELTYLFWA